VTLLDTGGVHRSDTEVVTQVFEAWNAGDMDRLRGLYHPEIVVRAPAGWPEPGPFVGREAVMRQFEEMRSTFDRDSLQQLNTLRRVGDRVVARVGWRATGRGLESDLEMTALYTVRGEQVVLIEFIWDHDDALKSAALTE
jgi:ketosteroid isomerase-like protein